MPDGSQNLLRASQQLNPRCPICNAKYEAQRIQILNETEQGVLSYFTCENCAASFLATVVETPFGHMASGLLTDLEAEEVITYAGSEAVSHDDVISVYQELERGNMQLQ